MEDTTSPQGPASFSSAEREAIYRVIRERRDIRKFVPTPIPDDVLRRILHMAHLAPSVGFMQPWSFILIRSLEVRRQIRDLFDAENARQLQAVPDSERQELYASLKLEGILESPLNIAVTCDHNRDAPFVLGRGSMPETDLFSTCLAIQNLWLAARAEGVGVGWVSILDRQASEGILHLPPGVQLVAYLCLGYPVEFRPRPLLEEVGWKEREQLARLVFEERWGEPASLFRQETP